MISTYVVVSGGVSSEKTKFIHIQIKQIKKKLMIISELLIKVKVTLLIQHFPTILKHV